MARMNLFCNGAFMRMRGGICAAIFVTQVPDCPPRCAVGV